MMHHTAHRLPDGSGWHYAATHARRGGHPLGYCAEHPPHPTEAEARECYAQYKRDHLELRDAASSWSDCEVKGCKNPANNVAQVRGYMLGLAVLCAEHFTREIAIEVLHLDQPAGDAWVS